MTTESPTSCKTLNPNLHSWFIVEIITFYGLIFSLIVYLICASIWKVKPHDFLLDEKYLRSDFLEWSSDVYYYFGLSLTLLSVSVAIYI